MNKFKPIPPLQEAVGGVVRVCLCVLAARAVESLILTALLQLRVGRLLIYKALRLSRAAPSSQKKRGQPTEAKENCPCRGARTLSSHVESGPGATPGSPHPCLYVPFCFLGGFARRWTPFKTFLFCSHGCLSGIRKSIKTFNNGSLGSGIDEERSEMR